MYDPSTLFFAFVGMCAVVAVVVTGLLYGAIRIAAWWRERHHGKNGVRCLVAAAVVLLLGGCAGLDYNKPQNAAEGFPARNQDPGIGLVIWDGTAPANIEVFDQAGRRIEKGYVSGATRWVQFNGRYGVQAWVGRLEPGSYRVVFRPFFYTVRLIPPGRYPVELPVQTAGIYVGTNPSACYEAGRYWGWCLHAGVNIPEGADPVPLMDLIRINLPFLGR